MANCRCKLQAALILFLLVTEEDPAVGAKPKKQSKVSSGDAEQTESDSEVDSLFENDSAVEEVKQERAGKPCA